MALNKRELFLKRRLRVRNKIKAANAGRLRLSVHRSSKNISVQLIDDVKGVTVAAASSLEKELGVVGKNNVEAAAKVGSAIAERAKNNIVALDVAETQRWRRTAASVETDWINEVKGKGIDGAKLAAEARALIEKHSK